jgi:4a-hydroxytetrahydrobiopterin dehydratase
MQLEHWMQVEHDGVAALRRAFAFPDWAAALAFVNAVGAIADAQDHHPLVELTWGRVVLTVWSHDAGGLTARDTRFCAAVNALPAAAPVTP